MGAVSCADRRVDLLQLPPAARRRRDPGLLGGGPARALVGGPARGGRRRAAPDHGRRPPRGARDGAGRRAGDHRGPVGARPRAAPWRPPTSRRTCRTSRTSRCGGRITVLREHRGDGHIAALVDAGLGGCEALVLHAATGEVPAPALRTTRAWTDEEWAATVEGLRARGLVEADGSFTDAGPRAARARSRTAPTGSACSPTRRSARTAAPSCAAWCGRGARRSCPATTSASRGRDDVRGDGTGGPGDRSRAGRRASASHGRSPRRARRSR